MRACILCSRPLPAIHDYCICSMRHEVRELLSFLRHRGAALAPRECAALGAQVHLAVQAAARTLEVERVG
eukprot:5149626-Alexandrium_andersonii.AAC.1